MTESGIPFKVNGFEILEKLAELQISSWNYSDDDDSVRHLGPMAQDFFAAFGLGDSDKVIYNVDANGVALLCIQALNRKLRDLEEEVGRLKRGNDEHYIA